MCGGGPGGIAAAVAAARNGADTMLVERYGFLGGMATAGLVNPFMPWHAGKEQIINGIFQEILDRLRAKGGLSRDRESIFDPEIMKVVADDICLESGVKLLLHSFVSGATVEGPRIASVTVTNKPDGRDITAEIFIDATGDADLAYMAGVPCSVGRESDGLAQPMTLNFRMAGVDTARVPPREVINDLYAKARQEGRINCPRENVLMFNTTRSGEIHFNTTRVTRADGTNAADLTRAEIEARRQVHQLVEFLKRGVPGFENAFLQMTGTQIGVRESRRIVGEYVMTVEDVLEGRKFDDCIARGSYPVDIHNPDGAGTVIRHLRPGESYDIPYRSIVPLKIDNLLVAGRPISTTHEAHSSTRIMPICFAVGEAAGTAAALCVRQKTVPRSLDVGVLQAVLAAQGANLGETKAK